MSRYLIQIFRQYLFPLSISNIQFCRIGVGIVRVIWFTDGIHIHSSLIKVLFCPQAFTVSTKKSDNRKILIDSILISFIMKRYLIGPDII